jgi:hypothetical protein
MNSDLDRLPPPPPPFLPKPPVRIHYTRRTKTPSTMNPDMQLLLMEIQKLSSGQTTIEKQLADQCDLLERHFVEVDDAMDKRFKEADAVVEQRIIDSELRQDQCLQAIEKTATDIAEWHQEHEGVVNDLRLRIGRLDKFWNHSIIEHTDAFTEPGIFSEPPVKAEQHAAPTSAGYTAARPNGHREELHHRENEYGEVTAYIHSLVTGMNDPPDPLLNPMALHQISFNLVITHLR